MLTAVHIHEDMVTWHQGNCTLLRGSKRFVLFDLHTSVGDGCHAVLYAVHSFSQNNQKLPN